MALLGKTEYRNELRNWNSPIPLNYQSALANLSVSDKMAMFASCWLPKGVTKDQYATMDHQEYQNMLSLHEKYEPRSQPFYAQFITAYLNNSSNSYLFEVVAPIFQTEEHNFHTLKDEIVQVGCDDLEEGGIASEGATTRWGWHDQLSRASTRRQISQELALDANYGGETILRTLADIGQNVVYHCLRHVMYSIREIGYSNIIRETMSDEHVDIAKLYAAEAEGFHIFAKDPHGALKLMMQKAIKFQGDLAIVKEGATQYLSLVGKETEARQIPAQSITYDRGTKQFTGMPIEGPKAFLSYRLGNDWFDIIENRSWRATSRSSYSEDPLELTTVHGQFYPPNPDFKMDDEVVSTNPDVLSMWVYYQTRTQDGDRKIPFVDCLRNGFMWDKKTGDWSTESNTMVAELNAKLTMSGGERPFQYQERTGEEYENGDTQGDYDSPSPAAMKKLRSTNTDDYRQMSSIRDIPAGVTFDAYANQFRTPKRNGDHHYTQTPDGWFMKGVRTARLKYEEENKRNIMVDFAKIFTYHENVSNADVTQRYFEALIDANIKEGDTFIDNGVLDIKPNRFYGLNLPASTDQRIDGMRYAPGFQSGAGMKTAAAELLKRGTAFSLMAEEATAAIAGAENIIRFLKKYVVKTDMIDYEHVPAWFQTNRTKETPDAVFIAFIDALFPSEGPVFLGVPGKAGDVVDLLGNTTKYLKDYLRDAPLDTLTVIPTNLNSDDSQRGLDASVRALSFLSKKTANVHKTDFLGDLTPQLLKLIEYINEYSGNANREGVEANRFILNAVTDEFIRLADATKQIAFIQDLKKNPDNYLKILKSSAGYKDNTPTLDGPIRTWEKESVITAQNKPASFGGKENRKFDDLKPNKYIRTPLIQSPSIRKFISDNPGFKWALPGDPDSNYTTPIFNRNRIQVLDDRNYLSFFQRLSGHVSVLSGIPGAFTQGDSTEGMSEEELLGLGATFDADHYRKSYTEKKEVDGAEILNELRREYFGPWQKRVEFMNSITDPADQFLYKALVESRDHLHVHEGFSKMGVKLYNAMLFRPSITTRSSSVLIMKAGIGTVGTPMSKLTVDLSSEARGYLTIVCWFYIGTLRVTPSAIEMILGAVPVDFIGGKDVNFIQDQEDFFADVRDRGSLLCIIIPVSENTFDDKLTLDNARAMARPDTYMTPFTGKWSGALKLCSVFGENEMNNIFSLHCDRTQFRSATPHVAIVQHRGFRSFIDPRTGERVDHEGTGPGGERCMNMSGAYKVWNGTATWYPTVTPSVFTKARAQ